jgi:hypothetical protein
MTGRKLELPRTKHYSGLSSDFIQPLGHYLLTLISVSSEKSQSPHPSRWLYVPIISLRLPFYLLAGSLIASESVLQSPPPRYFCSPLFLISFEADLNISSATQPSSKIKNAIHLPFFQTQTAPSSLLPVISTTKFLSSFPFLLQEHYNLHLARHYSKMRSYSCCQPSRTRVRSSKDSGFC